MRFQVKENAWFWWLAIPVTYLLLILYHGYISGHGDLAEHFAYSLYLADPSLYPNDFFIQSISQHIPNERSFSSCLVRLFYPHIEWGAFLIHVITSLSIAAGALSVFHIIVKDNFMALAGTLLLLIPMYGKSLGDNEIYYAMTVSSQMSKAFGIWALYYFMKGELKSETFFLIPATLFHPVAGTQLFLLFWAVRLVEMIRKREMTWKSFRYLLLFLVTAGVYLLLLLWTVGSESSPLLGEVLEFRLPHHYFPFYFKSTHYGVFGILILAVYYMYKRSLRLFLFCSFVVLGCILYSLFLEALGWNWVLNSQWFKSTIWLELVGLAALFVAVLQVSSYAGIPIRYSKVGLIGISLMLCLFYITQRNYSDNPYNFPFVPWSTPEVEIARMARENLPHDVCVLIPFRNDSFRYFSRRSTPGEAKSMFHRGKPLAAWYRRMQDFYGIDLAVRRSGKSIDEVATSHYRSLSEQDLLRLKDQYHISHMLTYSEVDLDFPIAFQSVEYKVYELAAN